MEVTWILLGMMLAGIVSGLVGAVAVMWTVKHELAMQRLAVDEGLERIAHLYDRLRKRPGPHQLPQDGFAAADPTRTSPPLTRHDVLRRAAEQGLTIGHTGR